MDLGNGIRLGQPLHDRTVSRSATANVPGPLVTAVASTNLRSMLAPSPLQSLQADLSTAEPLDMEGVGHALHVLCGATTAAEVMTAGAGLSAPPELLTAVATFAQPTAVVCTLLHTVERGALTTGRRYEPVFPANLVQGLWSQALPGLHSLYVQAKQQQRALWVARHQRGPRTAGVEPVVSYEPETLGDQLAMFVASYKDLRRALALRTRTLADCFAPDDLVLLLARMQHCGALSDDVLGPILSQFLKRIEEEGKALTSHVAERHALLARVVSVVPAASSSRHHPLQGSSAMTLARLLGRQQAPRHFHLHKLVHTVLLPALQHELARSAALVLQCEKDDEVAEWVPPASALLDLTRCFTTYAVSGTAAESLTVLWKPHLAMMSVSACTELLRILTSPPASVRTSPHRGHGGRHSVAIQSVLPQHARRSLTGMVQEEYAALMDAILCRVGHLCVESEWERRRTSTEIAPPSPPVTMEELLTWMEVLLKVNSAVWAETYLATASVLWDQLRASDTTPDDSRLCATLPVGQTYRVIKALLYRNTAVPHHPLHSILLRRMRQAPELQRDVGMAATVLLGIELMTSMGSASLRLPGDHGEHSPRPMREAEDGGDALVPADEVTEACVNLFTIHQRQLPPAAFVAAMCLCPLGAMPAPQQQRVVNHFTSIAASLPPTWMVKGMVAIFAQTAPKMVDAVSIKRWFSHFTAMDVVRRVDLVDCASLLQILASRPEYGIDNALAKRAVVTRVGVLLRSVRDTAAALEVLPTLMPALHAADVCFANLYSRMCRVVLSQSQQAPWAVLLPAFEVTAEEFMRRPRTEANRTVFRDVWELVRQRLMTEAAATLSREDTVRAWNAFAALDVGDQPLFLLLLHRLWVLLQGGGEDSTDSAVNPIGDERTCMDIAMPPTAAEVTRRATLQASQAQQILEVLSPSALAVLSTTLLTKGDGPDVDTLLPWVLLRLQRTCRNLYPMDVVATLPALLQALTGLDDVATSTATTGSLPGVESCAASPTDDQHVPLAWGASPLSSHILHRAYDACRSHFLYLYAELPTPLQQQPQPDWTDTDVSALATERAAWGPKAAASVNIIPKHYFANILVALGGCGMLDTPVAVACAAKLCTQRTCRGQLTPQQLVDVCLALCLQFPPTTTATPDGAAASLGPRFLPAVLDALWRRTDELSVVQIRALLRCLQHYYGSKVDADFVGRLNAQKESLEQQSTTRARPAAEESNLAAPPDVSDMSHTDVGGCRGKRKTDCDPLCGPPPSVVLPDVAAAAIMESLLDQD